VKDLRNPFRLQAAEHIGADSDFLRLFGPGVLDLLPDNALSGRTQFIRSAPGGGKTSLLKLFTPSVLNTLIALQGDPECRELYERLYKMGVVDQSNVRVTGLMLQCGRTFPDLADLGLPWPRARRLLMALLDARIMLGALRSALTVSHLRYPEDLGCVQIGSIDDNASLPGLQLPCDGQMARKWAESLEQSICDAIDSFAAPEFTGPPGHDSLLILQLFDHDAFRVSNRPQDLQWLILLDDVQKLTPDQREALIETLLVQRSTTTIWVAERFDALSSNDLLSTGALSGRDYGSVINLEESWGSPPKRFAKAMSAIADRRARIASDVVSGVALGSFTAIVDGPSVSGDWQERTKLALETVSERVREVAIRDQRYAEWVRAMEEAAGDLEEQLIRWRVLEILIERQRRKKQLSFDFVLSRKELEDKEEYNVRRAAELFLAKEFGFPYYFGSARLASLGSFNVEQYLQLAGDLFEESLARAVLREPPILPPEQQQKILVSASEARVEDVPHRVKNGRDVLRFLDAVGTFCHQITYQGNAPYAPGINGVALSMQERDLLLDRDGLRKNPAYDRFAQMLVTALAHNLLHAELDKSVKHQRWMVLYLNRLLCPNYELPLNFGNFRERRIRDLVTWTERGYQPLKTETLAL
jgi:hypothetical protein